MNGIRYSFDVFGLYNGLFVMADRSTGSVWTHYDGRVLTGPLAEGDIQLEIIPLMHTTWQAWSELHPDTTVLDWYPEYADRYRDVEPGRGGLGARFEETLLNRDDRLVDNQLVLGVQVGASYRAYVLDEFGPDVTVVNDVLSDQPIVLFFHAEESFALAFSAVVDGKTLAFTSDGDIIRDTSGTVWLLNGTASGGPLAGVQLDVVTSFVTEWYGWAAYHPETSIYGR